jgi:hypothetical protein
LVGLTINTDHEIFRRDEVFCSGCVSAAAGVDVVPGGSGRRGGGLGMVGAQMRQAVASDLSVYAIILWQLVAQIRSVELE